MIVQGTAAAGPPDMLVLAERIMSSLHVVSWPVIAAWSVLASALPCT